MIREHKFAEGLVILYYFAFKKKATRSHLLDIQTKKALVIRLIVFHEVES